MIQSYSCRSHHSILCFPEGGEIDKASLNLSIAIVSHQIHLLARLMLFSILATLLWLTAVFKSAALLACLFEKRKYHWHIKWKVSIVYLVHPAAMNIK